MRNEFGVHHDEDEMTTPRKYRSKGSPPMESDSSEVRPDGKVSNGDIMLEMLGNEPDVSHTSRELARKLGLPESVISRLHSGKRDTGESSE